MRSFLLLIKNEVLKELYTTLSYKFQWLGELIAVSVFYFYLSYLSSGRGFSFDSYSIWFFSIILIGDLSNKIATEMNLGTFEHNYLSVFSLKTIFLAKIAAAIFRVCSILLFLQLIHYATTQSFISFRSYLVMFEILPSLVGISFMLSGLTFALKDIGWISNILNNTLLFLSGVFFGSGFFPSWIEKISILLPTRLGEMLRQASLFTEVSSEMILIHYLVYPLLGSFVLSLCERRARSKGTTSFY